MINLPPGFNNWINFLIALFCLLWDVICCKHVILKIRSNLFDKEILAYLVQNSFLTNLSKSIYVKQEWFNKSKEIILKHFDHNDTLDIQTAKNLLTLSRKLTVLILEKLDSENITRRIDNKRILIK